MRSDLDHILHHTKDLWSELKGQNLFLLGGTGFFGKWFVESFIHANEQLNLRANLTVLSRNPEKLQKTFPHFFTQSNVEWIKGDLLSVKFPDKKYSYLIHAATDVTVTEEVEQLKHIFDICDLGTRRILEFARVSGVKKLLLTSSGAVYGKQPVNLSCMPETYSGGPDLSSLQSCYGEGKRVSELLCRLYAETFQIEVKIARCFAFMGPHLPLNGHFAAGNFMRNASRGEDIEIRSDGRPLRSYLYAADLMIWLWTILFKGASGEAYNVGSDQAVSVRELAEKIVKCSQKNLGVATLKEISSAPTERYIPDVQKAKNELGLQVRIELSEAISRTLSWTQKQEGL